MELDPQMENIQSEVRSELINSSGNIFLFSSENMTLVDPKAIKDFFDSCLADVQFKIIFFARTQDELAESQYNQDVKWTGETLSFEDYIAISQRGTVKSLNLIHFWSHGMRRLEKIIL